MSSVVGIISIKGKKPRNTENVKILHHVRDVYL